MLHSTQSSSPWQALGQPVRHLGSGSCDAEVEVASGDSREHRDAHQVGSRVCELMHQERATAAAGRTFELGCAVAFEEIEAELAIVASVDAEPIQASGRDLDSKPPVACAARSVEQAVAATVVGDDVGR